MKITDVRTVQLSRPLDQPQRTAQGGRIQRVFIFVLVETDAGIVGVGDAFGDDLLMEHILGKSIGTDVHWFGSYRYPGSLEKAICVTSILGDRGLGEAQSSWP